MQHDLPRLPGSLLRCGWHALNFRVAPSWQIAILKSCQDANIVSFLGSCTDSQQTLLITECAPPMTH